MILGAPILKHFRVFAHAELWIKWKLRANLRYFFLFLKEDIFCDPLLELLSETIIMRDQATGRLGRNSLLA